MTESVSNVPLIEVGSVWMRAAGQLRNRVSSALWNFMDADLLHLSWTSFIALALLAVSFYYIYQVLFAPVNRIKLLGDIGAIPDSKLSRRDIAERAKHRHMGDLPPVFPNGWFSICESAALAPAQATTVSYMGN